MKILLSAYACEPHKGSEPAVGWNWMLALVKQGHEMWVMTRSNNATSVDAQIREHAIPVNPVYYDLPKWCRRWKRWPGGLYFYYLIWQFGAYLRAKKLHAAQSFDIVHHITFVTFRQPSFMGWLGIPFILGPVGGGEVTPQSLRQGLNWSGSFREMIRDLVIATARFDPLMNATFSKASLIACTTRETKERVPHRFHAKCMIMPAIGIDTLQWTASRSSSNAGTNFLFVGRLLYWKGVHLVLRALPEVQRHIPDARLRVIGEGKDGPWLKRVAEECCATPFVDWIPWMAHKDIVNEYRGNVAFVFPSFHDSGGMVVLEALAAGLPVICLNLGGPGIIVDSSCGIVLDATNPDERAVEKSLAAAMITLATQPGSREFLAANCPRRAQQFDWESAVKKLYSSLNITAEQLAAPK